MTQDLLAKGFSLPTLVMVEYSSGYIYFYIVFNDLFLNRFSRHMLATTGDPSVVTGYTRV